MRVGQCPEELHDKIERFHSGSGYLPGNPRRRYSQAGILFSPRNDSNSVRSYWILFPQGKWTTSCLENSYIPTLTAAMERQIEDQLSGLNYCSPTSEGRSKQWETLSMFGSLTLLNSDP